MPAIHRQSDGRTCGAVTTVVNQSTTFANGKLIASEGDPNSHGGGGLIARCNNVFVAGKMVAIHAPNNARADSKCPKPGVHCNPATAGGSSDTFVGS